MQFLKRDEKIEKKYELINITLNTLIKDQNKSIDFLEMLNNCGYYKLNDLKKKMDYFNY